MSDILGMISRSLFPDISGEQTTVSQTGDSDFEETHLDLLLPIPVEAAVLTLPQAIRVEAVAQQQTPRVADTSVDPLSKWLEANLGITAQFTPTDTEATARLEALIDQVSLQRPVTKDQQQDLAPIDPLPAMPTLTDQTVSSVPDPDTRKMQDTISQDLNVAETALPDDVVDQPEVSVINTFVPPIMGKAADATSKPLVTRPAIKAEKTPDKQFVPAASLGYKSQPQLSGQDDIVGQILPPNAPMALRANEPEPTTVDGTPQVNLLSGLQGEDVTAIAGQPGNMSLQQAASPTPTPTTAIVASTPEDATAVPLPQAGVPNPPMSADQTTAGSFATTLITDPELTPLPTAIASEPLARPDLPLNLNTTPERAIPVQTPQVSTPHNDPRPVMQQVTSAMVTTREDTTEIALSPEELGRIRLVMSGPDRSHITIWAERPETLDLVRRNADMLTQHLQEAGIDAQDLDFRQDSGGTWKNDMPDSTGHGDADITGPATTTQIQLAPTPVSDRRVDIRL
ncbi:flagellar hook-length control protein FliK [Paracoccus sp. JM45]|uniref:flagellar hook-length control protein FliK n=1 Tax=Paracoccus sp. JM45 TaxID=2283626 RepID=UPI000E6B7BE1|nr:flagellar hook-length control protein FliK [Paracoccus sp. JM45]RJE80895.1 flagellar hook-length control protein FliK [Paracoccus sp. JM45]